jgi:hypothetical protein
MGLHFQAPKEWEIAGHSFRADTGRLMLVDRYRQRMQISWTRCPRKPDAKQIFDDFEARDRKDHPDCTIDRSFSLNRWAGFRRGIKGSLLTRAGLYDSANGRWIDVAIPWTEGFDEETEQTLLGKLKTSNMHDERQRWRAFNVDVESPPQWYLSAGEIKPADVSLTFEKDHARVTIHKLGLADMWFNGDTLGFLRKQAEKNRGAYAETEDGRHPGGVFNGRERMFHPGWLWGKRLIVHGHAWLCPPSNALFHISVTSFPGQAVTGEEFTVRCCDAVGKG